MTEVLKKFGRYFLLDQIAQGGMAEIYRARMASVDGAGRLIVIKRIQAGFDANSEFLQMFKSEIKVTMGFNHANIVQVYDFGEEQNQPYIAMELVDGKNLRQLLNKYNEQKQSFPVELAVAIMEQSAAGLHYAHSYKDKITGAPLNIVHRDISPQNILISFEGAVKVIDFGIAKATTNSEHTRAGVIKGKPSYLSPEQISGDPLDGRCDIFALGIVFWELLTSKKLFAGENDLAILKQIESCSTSVKPPSTVNPKVPKEIDQIVLKMLAKQKEKRFQTAEELQRALRKFLNIYAPDFTQSDLSFAAKSLFKNEIVEDRKKIKRLNDQVELLLANNDVIIHTPKVELGSSTVIRKEDTTTYVDAQTIKKAAEFKVDQQEIKQTKVEFDNLPIERVARTRPELSRSTQTSRSTEQPVPGSMLKVGLAVAAALLGVVFVGPQMGLRIPGISDRISAMLEGNKRATVSSIPRAAQPTHVAPEAISTATDPGHKGNSKAVTLKINLFPSGPGANISLNGRSTDSSRPDIQAQMDTPLELVITKPGFKTFRREFSLESLQLGQISEYPMDIALDPEKFGFLTIYTTPSAEATIMVDGKVWAVKNAPFENEKLPIGKYTVKLLNNVLDLERVEILSVEENKVALIKGGLSPRAPASAGK